MIKLDTIIDLYKEDRTSCRLMKRLIIPTDRLPENGDYIKIINDLCFKIEDCGRAIYTEEGVLIPVYTCPIQLNDYDNIVTSLTSINGGWKII